jgi:hypothetical protein
MWFDKHWGGVGGSHEQQGKASIMASDITYQYVTEPGSGLECVICLEVAEEPWQHGLCGRLLCKKCLDTLGEDKPCPNCREDNPKYFQDNKSKFLK